MAEKKVILIGKPVSHSLSPVLHRYWLRELDIPGSFEARQVERDEIPALVLKLAKGQLVGLNATLPYKESLAAFAENLSGPAVKLKAANILYISNRKLTGLNTDPEGFYENLKFSVPGWNPEGKRALILGTGAAAGAVALALAGLGMDKILICGRAPEKTRKLIKRLSGENLTPVSWQQRNAFSKKLGLVVNATPLGLEGFGPVDFDLKRLPETALVYDLVYGACPTAFLKAAQNRGLKTVDGLGMLVFQGIPAFRAWYGKSPEISPALMDQLRKKL